MTAARSEQGGPLLRTRSGRMVNPLDPDPGQLVIEDVAYALASIPRYGGHTRLSVAQHAATMADVYRVGGSRGAVPAADVAERARLALDALMHDASEYLLGDIPSPLKRLPGFTFYREAEDRLMHVLAEKFRFRWPMPPEIAALDRAMRKAEQADLMGVVSDPADAKAARLACPGKVTVWTAAAAENGFLARFRELSRKTA